MAEKSDANAQSLLINSNDRHSLDATNSKLDANNNSDTSIYDMNVRNMDKMSLTIS